MVSDFHYAGAGLDEEALRRSLKLSYEQRWERSCLMMEFYYECTPLRYKKVSQKLREKAW